MFFPHILDQELTLVSIAGQRDGMVSTETASVMEGKDFFRRDVRFEKIQRRLAFSRPNCFDITTRAFLVGVLDFIVFHAVVRERDNPRTRRKFTASGGTQEPVNGQKRIKRQRQGRKNP